MFEGVEEFAKINDPLKSKKLVEEMISKYKRKFLFKSETIKRVKMAFEAVYGYADPQSSCGKDNGGCHNYGIRIKAVLQLNGLKPTEKINCLECCQLSYIAMLKSLTEGKYVELNKLHFEVSEEHKKEEKKFFADLIKAERTGQPSPNQANYPSVYNPGNNPILKKSKSLDYTNAQTLIGFLFQAGDCFYTKFETGNDAKLIKKTHFIHDFLGDPLIVIYPRHPRLIETRFNRFVKSFVGWSLAKFIMNDDLKKLKICQLCKEFFVSNKRDKRIKYCSKCSSKCKMTREERKEYQKKYYWNSKRKNLMRARELIISDYMNKLGCTRQEALKVIEADSSL